MPRRRIAALAAALSLTALAAGIAAAQTPTFTVEVGDVEAVERDAGTSAFAFNVTVTRSADITSETVTVDYSVPDTAETPDASPAPGSDCANGGDYEPGSGQLTFSFGAGDTSKTQQATVLVCGDEIDELGERFRVDYTASSNAAFAGGKSHSIGTIENDDDPTLSVSVAATDKPTGGADRDVREGNASRDVTVRLDLTHPSNEAIHLTVDTADGAAKGNEDYVPIVAGSVSIPAGSHAADAPEATITVRILGDSTDEVNEDFDLGLAPTASSGGLTIDNDTLTIVNDDDPAFTVSNESVAEGSEEGATTPMTFTVTLTNNSLQPVQLAWQTSSVGDEHDADPDGDYQSANGSISIASGNRTATINVTINGDDAQEPDETFALVVSRAESSQGGTTNKSASGIGTILNDDGVTPAISIEDASAPEGGPSEITEIPLTVRLSNPTQEQVKVDYLTEDGTATTATKDYEPLEGTLTFAPGEMEKTITVWVYGDEFPGPSEHFFVNLVTPINATIADAQAKITIENDDGPVIHVDDVEIIEPDTGETVTATLAFTLSETSQNEVSVKYETLDGTATAGEDYTAQTGTVKFPAGQKSASISIPIRGDDVTEEDETFTVELSEPAEGTPARTSITVTIIDDESGEPGAGSILVQARDTDDSCPSGSVPEDGYKDADGSVHEAAIDCLVWWNVTSGDGKGGFSPTQPVTRGQMATFIARTLAEAGVSLPEDPEDRFTDDSGDVHERSINQLAELEVVSGRVDGTFGPTEFVSRAAMATFLAKAYETATGEALTSTKDHFDDDSGDTHETNINAVAEVRVAVGDGRGSYSPTASVRRDQMASFLVRLLDLFVEEGHAETPA